MWNGHLSTLSRLTQSSLASAEFAFLSCCVSAEGTKQLPNEATIWSSVEDKDALSVTMQIYGELLKDVYQVGFLLRQHLCCTRPTVVLLGANNVPLARYHLFTFLYIKLPNLQ